MQTEIWRPVKGYEGLYAVSNLGRVKSIGNNKSRKEKILKPQKEGKGYLFVRLYRNGKGKKFKVHRLVASAFIPNPEGLPEVNHKNEVKDNNVVGNLEWCSRWYNAHYGTLYERSAAAHLNHPALSKAVEASKYPDFREIELRFPSTMEVKRNGYTYSAVSACCRGCYSTHRRNFYKNLYWRFADESEDVIMQRRQIEIFMNVINNFKEKCLI